MPGVYKVTEVAGTSTKGFDDAVRTAIAEVSKTVRHMAWFEVVEQRGRIVDEKIDEFQVILKVGFKVEH